MRHQTAQIQASIINLAWSQDSSRILTIDSLVGNLHREDIGDGTYGVYVGVSSTLVISSFCG